MLHFKIFVKNVGFHGRRQCYCFLFLCQEVLVYDLIFLNLLVFGSKACLQRISFNKSRNNELSILKYSSSHTTEFANYFYDLITKHIICGPITQLE